MDDVVDRRALGMREMLGAMAALALLLLAVLAVSGVFSAGNDADDAPVADVESGIARARAELDLPLVTPAGLPAGWRANSFTVGRPEMSPEGGGVLVVRGGWLTDTGLFITLLQSPAEPTALVSQEVGQGLADLGSVQAGGATWSIFPGQRREQTWVRTVDELTLLITGSAGEADFRILAEAVGAAGR